MQVNLIDFKAKDGTLLNGFITSCNSKKVLIATHGMSSNCFKERERTIAKYCVENKIDFLCYNNRGSELVKYIKKIQNNEEKKVLAGTSYENVLDGYFDIVGAIEKAVSLGYSEIYLQGHSLGSTKTVYTYCKLKEENNELLKYIKGIILLSLVDIPRALTIYNSEKKETFFKYAETKKKEGKEYELMPKECFIHPISVYSYLIYSKDNKEIDFARYSNDTEFEKLNNIEVPLFMRWGNVYEMIEQDAKELSNKLNIYIKNKNKDINYIDGADHGYTGKEDILAKQIINFLNKI